MKSGWILSIGALFCTAVAVLSRIWLPYADTGVDTSAYYHVTATIGLMMFIMLFFGYLAMGFHESDGSLVSESYGSLVTATYLGLAALVMTGLFVWTYWGLSYSLFWAALVVMFVILGVFWMVSTKAVAPMAAAREGNARVVGIRKQGVIDSLLDASNACQKIGTSDIERNTAKALKKTVEKLLDEFKFFPNHATGAEAAELIAELNKLVQEINGAVKTTLTEDQLKTLLDELSSKITTTQRHVAQWKRV